MSDKTITNLSLNSGKLNENGQTYDIKFSLGCMADDDNNYHQCIPFVKCRDYFSDELFYCEVHNGNPNNDSVYGFTPCQDMKWFEAYKNNKPVFLYVLSGLNEGVTVEHLQEKFENLPIKKLESVTDSNTKIIDKIKADEKRNLLVIELNPMWLSTTVHIHLFMSLLRSVYIPELVEAIENTLTYARVTKSNDKELSIYSVFRSVPETYELSKAKQINNTVIEFLQQYTRSPQVPLTKFLNGLNVKALTIGEVHGSSGISSFLSTLTTLDFNYRTVSQTLATNFISDKFKVLGNNVKTRKSAKKKIINKTFDSEVRK